MKIYLMDMDNHSQYIRDLIDKDRIEKGDPKIIKAKIEEYNQAIKELENRVKIDHERNAKIQECLTVWYHTFVSQDRLMYERHFNLTWISDKVLPELKKLGCTHYSKDNILEMFEENSRQKKVILNVRNE